MHETRVNRSNIRHTSVGVVKIFNHISTWLSEGFYHYDTHLTLDDQRFEHWSLNAIWRRTGSRRDSQDQTGISKMGDRLKSNSSAWRYRRYSPGCDLQTRQEPRENPIICLKKKGICILIKQLHSEGPAVINEAAVKQQCWSSCYTSRAWSSNPCSDIRLESVNTAQKGTRKEERDFCHT